MAYQTVKSKVNQRTQTSRRAAPVVARATSVPAVTSELTSPREVLQAQHVFGNRAVNTLQRKPIQSGELDSTLSDTINRTRGGGQPLPDRVRGSMESAFRSDFGGVRIHTDQQADTLNRSVQAKAFTLGNDIYFRTGNYQPGNSSGQELLAHELTHVVQQSGSNNRVQGKLTVGPASDRYEQEADRVAKQVVRGAKVNQTAQRAISVQRAPQRIQRAVGFEFEANYVTKELKPEVATLSDTDAQTFLPFSHPNLNKQDVILKAGHFEVQADELPGGGSDMEFVTSLPPFEEDNTGRAQLIQTMQEIRAIGHFLEAEKATYKGVAATKLAPYGTVVNPRAVIVPSQKSVMRGSPQATAALRLEQVNRFMTDTGADQTGHPDPNLQPGRDDIMGMTPGDAAIAGRAAAGARQAVQQFLTGQRHVIGGFATTSQKLLGLVTLLASYLIRGDEQTLSYAKNIAILMARTDFATQFKQLLPEEQQYLKAGNGAAFVNLVLDAAGLAGTEATPLFRQGLNYAPNKKNLLDDLTRGKWLRGIAKGTDYLTKKNIGQKRGGEMESLGALGKKTEKVGNDRKAAPIFELRRIKQSVPYTDWPNLALDIFDYLRALNTGAGATYSRQANVP